MSQSGYIGGALLLGFILYLAAKNRLTVYASVLWGPSPSSSPSSSGKLPAGSAKAALSDLIFGKGASNVPTQNPISGTLSAITSVIVPLLLGGE